MRDIYILSVFLKRLFLHKQNYALVSTQVPFDVHFKLKGIFLERHLHLGESHLINPVNRVSGDVQLFAQLGLNFLFI